MAGVLAALSPQSVFYKLHASTRQCNNSAFSISQFTSSTFCLKTFLFHSQAHGAVDYIALSKEFDVVLVRDVPQMNIFRKTEARRFITMIDTFYDAKVSDAFL